MSTIATSDVSKPTINDSFLKDIDLGVTDFFKIDAHVDFDGRKTPVIYVSQERWALQQRQKGYRDENGVIILPLIAVRRLETTELNSRYVPKTDATRVLVDKRIATQSYDRKEKLPYFTNVRLNFNSLASRGLSRYGISKYGEAIYGLTHKMPLGASTLMTAPIYELVMAQYPTFIKLRYNVTLFFSFLSQANQLQENIWKKFDAGRAYFKRGGYYMFATIDGSSDQSNVEDFVDNQRIIKYQYNFTVQCPLISKEDVKIQKTSMLTFEVKEG